MHVKMLRWQILGPWKFEYWLEPITNFTLFHHPLR